MKKITIITIIVLVSCLAAVAIVLLYQSRSNKLSDATEARRWGLEEQTSLAKMAVEAYASQDTKEAASARHKRLVKYFSSDSPTLMGGSSVLSEDDTKSSAEVISVDYCEEQEGDNLCLFANTELTYTSDYQGTHAQSAIFWLTITQEPSGEFRVYEIDLWDTPNQPAPLNPE